MKIETESPIIEVSDASFVREVLRADVPVLAFFYTEWSWSCRSLNSLLAEIAAEHPNLLKVVKANVDRNPGLATWYPVHCVPTLLCVSDGEETQWIVGSAAVGAFLRKLIRTTYSLDAHAAVRE